MLPEDKVFGLENFGNTCYCNSVVQALYHIKPFRDYVLGISPVDRPRRLRTPGKETHSWVITAQNAAAEQQQQQQKQASDGGLSSSQRSGFSVLKSRFSSSRHSEHGSAASNTSSVSPTQPALSLNTHLASTHLGSIPENSGYPVPLVGFVDDEPGTPVVGSPTSSTASTASTTTESLIDLRKRNALLKGPIVNVDLSFSDAYRRSESLVTALKDLFESIAENESVTGVASPAHLVKVLKSENSMFRSSMHQDAQEFLNFLLNRIMEEDVHGGQATKFDMFSGELTSELRCVYCETVTRRNEPCFDFSLEALADTSVYNSLKQFSAAEVMGGSNKFFCDVCGAHQEAVKRMKVRKAPPVLILHLKRFKFSEDEQCNTKLLNRVLYSKYLRLPVATEDCPTPEKLYELTSVIVHLGGGPSMGHYVVVSKTPRGWILFDDEIADRVDESYVFRFFGDNASLSTAYLLMYQEVTEEQHEADNLGPISPAQRRTSAASQAASEDSEDGKRKRMFSFRKPSQ